MVVIGSMWHIWSDESGSPSLLPLRWCSIKSAAQLFSHSSSCDILAASLPIFTSLDVIGDISAFIRWCRQGGSRADRKWWNRERVWPASKHTFRLKAGVIIVLIPHKILRLQMLFYHLIEQINLIQFPRCKPPRNQNEMYLFLFAAKQSDFIQRVTVRETRSSLQSIKSDKLLLNGLFLKFIPCKKRSNSFSALSHCHFCAHLCFQWSFIDFSTNFRKQKQHVIRCLFRSLIWII